MNRRLFLLSATAATALGACAPMALQSPLTPAAGFSGPSFDGDWFVSFDGARLGATSWAAVGETRVVLVGLHGMNDYANAFHMAAPDWAARGVATYAFDQRGFGRSVGRGIWAGRELMSEDLRVFVTLVKARHPGVPIVVAGESMGGAVAICAFASDRPPAADRLLLLAPAVWGWSSQPLPYKTVLWITARVSPGQPIKPPGWLTNTIHPSDNREEMIAMGRDRLMIWGARPDTISGLVDLMEAAWREIGAVKVPIAYLYGANDQVIPEAPSRQAAAKLKAGDKTAWYAKGYHLLIRDHQRQTVIDDAASFILNPDAPLRSGAPRIPRPGMKPSRV